MDITLEDLLNRSTWKNGKILGCFNSIEEAGEQLQVLIDLLTTMAHNSMISALPISTLVTSILISQAEQYDDTQTRNLSDQKLRDFVARLTPLDMRRLLQMVSAMVIARSQFADQENHDQTTH